MAKFSALGENIAWVEGYPSMGNQLHVGWMRSEGHRANMLQRGFDSVGIGVVCSGGRAWATQNFGRLDSSSAPSMGSQHPGRGADRGHPVRRRPLLTPSAEVSRQAALVVD